MREFSIPLICGVLSALLWANTNFSGYQSYTNTPWFGRFSFHTISNELFMVFFFGIAAVEITKSCLPGGALNPLSRAVNPLLGTLGGVLGPIAVFLGLNELFGASELANGWGIPTATDIALVWFAARLVFGAAHPAVSYLLLLAVADDAVGLLIIALFYTNPLHPVAPHWLLLTGLGMVASYCLRRLNIRSYWPYLIIGGSTSWIGLHLSHLHPALALVFIIPFLPHRRRGTKHLFEADLSDRTTLSKFEHEWKVLVDFGLFMFGLANAGVEFTNIGTVSWLVLSSLIIGKTLGIFSFGCLSGIIGFGLPCGMRRRDLLVAGVIAGTGFTVALFVAGEAFSDPVIKGSAKMGAMLSILAALIGILLGRLVGVRKIRM